MKIILTQTAEKSFKESYHYLYEINPLLADRVYDELVGYIFNYLGNFPHLGHKYNAEQNIYRLIHSKTNYNVYYQVKNKVIYILYIVDGKRHLNQQILEADF